MKAVERVKRMATTDEFKINLVEYNFLVIFHDKLKLDYDGESMAGSEHQDDQSMAGSQGDDQSIAGSQGDGDQLSLKGRC